MNNRTDKMLTGFLLGLLSPPVAFLIFCYFSLPDESIAEVIRRYNRLNVLTHVISLSVIVNLAIFFITLRLHKEKAARGVLGATFVYVFLVLIIKFL
jgi:uncharacterized protein (DUF486 family)